MTHIVTWHHIKQECVFEPKMINESLRPNSFFFFFLSHKSFSHLSARKRSHLFSLVKLVTETVSLDLKKHKNPPYFILGSFQTIKRILNTWSRCNKMALSGNVSMWMWTSDLCHSQPDACQTDFDAVSMIRGELFFFKSGYVWRIRDGHLQSGYPALASRHWRGIPDNIDAAFEDKSGNIWFFQGGQRCLSCCYVVYGFLWAQDHKVSCASRQV